MKRQIYNFNKRNFNYYFNKHKENSINTNLKIIKEFNVHNNPDLRLPKTESFQHHKSFYYDYNFSGKFLHQTLACILNKNSIHLDDIIPEAKTLADYYSKNIKVGAYSDSNGVQMLRENIIRLKEKEGEKNLFPKDFFFTNGSLNAYEQILSTICNENDQIMIPNPCYPFISNITTSKSLNILEYNLKEDSWEFDFENMERIFKANNDIYPIKAMVIINPHDPTGIVYSPKTIEKVINFCYEKKLSLISLEFSKNSILKKEKANEFQTTLKVLQNMPSPISNKQVLFSVTGLTRGFPNLSSLRSGLVHTYNLDEFVHSQTLKYKSIDLCSSILSQIAYDLVYGHDYREEFGKEFGDKYYQSIDHINKIVLDKKDSILKILKNNPKKLFNVQDIDAGNNLFIKFNELSMTAFLNKYYEKFGKDILNPGNLYGFNRDNYVCLTVDPESDYDFLNI